MNIKEAERLTGIAKQNIRYYERQGLLRPGRGAGNNYRDYGPGEARALKLIKMLRKLDMPTREIQRVLERETPLPDALEAHLCQLREQQRGLEAAIRFCQSIRGEALDNLDVDARLSEIDRMEASGGVFKDILRDFQTVMREETRKQFSFMPDTMVQTPAEFTLALLRYANENNLDLVITKEGMYPEFRIGGTEYTAERRFSRFGAVIRCSLAHPRDGEAAGISPRRRKWLRLARAMLLPAGIFAFLVLTRLNSGAGAGAGLLPALALTAAAVGLYRFLPER